MSETSLSLSAYQKVELAPIAPLSETVGMRKASRFASFEHGPAASCATIQGSEHPQHLPTVLRNTKRLAQPKRAASKMDKKTVYKT